MQFVLFINCLSIVLYGEYESMRENTRYMIRKIISTVLINVSSN